MDNFVSKLRQTVSQVAHQVNTSVNTIIPGNLIHREYELFKFRCTHGSPKFLWQVHDAVKRDSVSIKASLKDAIGPNLLSISNENQVQLPSESKSANINEVNSKQLFSVFVFDKKQLDVIPNKIDRELALEHIKKGVTQLTRLRHPSILTVHHPLEESRSSLAFVTEHVYGNLDSILNDERRKRVNSKPTTKKVSDNLVDLTTDLGPKDSDYQSDNCELDEIQIKAGLLQLCDGLQFLHNDAKLLHRNLCLDDIFVDFNNTWKIAGFDFCCQQLRVDASEIKSNNNTGSGLEIVEFNPKPSSNLVFPSLRTLSSSISANLIPNWSCSAPEHSNCDQVSLPSDIYSLGLIACALLGTDPHLKDLSYEYGIMSDTYKRGLLCREIADRLPSNIKTSIMKFASLNEATRPSLEDFKNLPLFQDPQVQAIRDLDSQFAWDRLKKIDFFNRLRDTLPKLSHQVRVNRIAKSLFIEALNSDMLPYIMPNIMIISKDCTPTEFKTKIFPNLRGPLRILEPKAVPMIILDNLPILADRAKLCLPEFQKASFTLIQYLLKLDEQMQEKCFLVLPKVRKFIDDGSMIKIILPELARVCKETNNLKIRVGSLDCICKLVDIIESTTIINQVLPIVYSIPSREAEVIMAAVAIVKTIMNDSKADLTKDIIACKIVPFLVPCLIEKDLTLQQFETIVSINKKLLDRIEREQRELLARKNQVSNQQSKPLVLDDFKGSDFFTIN